MAQVNDSAKLMELAANHGVENIGGTQRTIAYTAIADAGGGLLTVSAAGHNLKKHQSFYFASGAGYIGQSFKVKKILTTGTFQIEGTFAGTVAGNINLTVCVGGHGFVVKNAIVIAEFVPDDATLDTAALIAGPYVAQDIITIPFKKLHLTSGDVVAVRKTPQTDLPYINR